MRLRPLEYADLPLTLAWRNAMRENFLTSEIVTPEQHERWFREYAQRTNDRTYIIESNGWPMGQIALYDMQDGAAQLGRFLVAFGGQRQGVGTWAVQSVLTEAWIFGCRHIWLRVRKTNDAAVALYWRCGFVVVADDGSVLRMEVSKSGV